MCVSNNNVKYCIKHDCSYVQRGSSNRTHCRECTNERNRNTVRSQKAKENKREIDRIYQAKKRLENPVLLKEIRERYKQTEKGRDWKIRNAYVKSSHIYCIKCNIKRVYNNDYCSECVDVLRIIKNHDFISVCKHCNKEYGLDVKISNHGKVFQLNKYCSIDCNNERKIHIKKYHKIKSRKHRRIKEDKQWAKKYGNKYEPISRMILYRKHQYICTSCGVKCVHPNKDNYNQSNAATLDHIIPKSKGGSHTYDNVTLLCRSCNTIKSDKILLDYKRNIGQIEIEFTGYIPQGSQLQLQLE
jgi:hypothetical protein